MTGIMTLLINSFILLGVASLNLIWGKSTKNQSRKTQIFYGIFFSFTIIALLIHAWESQNGLIYDARTILLSVVALMYQPLTIILTAATGVIYRLYLGGIGTLAGVVTIVMTVVVTYAWKLYIQPKLHKLNRLIVYWLFGLYIHLFMLLYHFTLPLDINIILQKISEISITVIGIYPFIIVILIEFIRLNNSRIDSANTLSKSEEQYRLLFNNVPAGIFHYDTFGIVQTCNETFCDIIGSTFDVLIGLDMKKLPNSGIVDALEISTKGFNGHYKGPYTSVTSGKELYVDVNFSTLRNLKGEIIGGVGVVQDLTEQVKKDEQIKTLQNTCPITGLQNRKIYEQHVFSDYFLDVHPLTFSLVSINNFQFIIDTMGYSASEQLLKDVSGILTTYIPKEYVYRIADRDFALVFPHDLKNTGGIITKIQNKIKELDEYSASISVSIVEVLKESIEDDWREINRKARGLMYSAKLYATESITKKTIDLLMASLFEKSPREKIHSDRVSKTSILLASELGLKQDQIDKVEISSVLHDIGKLNIDEAILEKKSSLTKREYEKVKSHTEVGYRILSSVDEYKEIAKIVLSHHERWDGLGYPEGLIGESIPLESRIISVCDSYDAMVNDRPYRNALTEEKAVQELKDNAGTQFDPDIVKTFIQYLEKNIL